MSTSSKATPSGPHELNDAYWSLNQIEYVSQPPDVPGSVFDDEDKLDRSLKFMLSTLEAEARESGEAQDRIARKTRELIATLEAEQPASTVELGEVGLDAAKGPHRFVIFRRLARSIRALVRSPSRSRTEVAVDANR